MKPVRPEERPFSQATSRRASIGIAKRRCGKVGPRGGRVSGPLVFVVYAIVCMAARLASAACPGDCNNDGRVAVDELRAAMQAALAGASSLGCLNADSNLDNRIHVEEVVAAVASAASGCPPPPQPIFPSNYRDSFVEVRSCRIGNEHDGYAIRVLANPIAAQAYLDESKPLPVGSIVLKEEFVGTDCRDDSKLFRWSVMRKEEAGFDPVDADWHWQRARVDGSLLIDGKGTCISCHRAPVCTARDYMCTEPLQPPTPRLVFEELPATLWAISGTSASDVYAVGGDPESDDFGPYVLHYDGNRWQRLRTPITGAALRWISVTPIDGSFYMAGDNGVVLLLNLNSRQFVQQTTPSDATLFGIWGSSANDVWAVGGARDSTSADQGGVLWHYDGTAWAEVDLSALRPQGVPTLFKVWGRSSSDVYVVGQRGIILHYDGTAWREMDSPTQRPLITIHGNSRSVSAVGGFESGVIIEQDGDSFVDRTPPAVNQLNGVFLPEEGGGVAVGNEGAYASRARQGWEVQASTDTVFGFHAAWVDDEGGLWVAGGDLNTDLKHGLVGYAGSRSISGQIVDIDPCVFSPGSGATTVSFAEDIAPLFLEGGCRAAGCHTGPQNLAASRYAMTTYAGLFKAGALAKSLKVCPIVPGDADASFLVEKLRPITRPNAGVQMPIGAGSMPFSEEEVGRVRTWILEGAQDN